MADFNTMRSAAGVGTRTAQIDEGLRAHMNKVYGLMSVAMLSIPVVDGLAKYLSAAYSPLFIGWARYVLACAIVLPFAAVGATIPGALVTD